ncbi:MAG: flavodoxin family protein [Butyricicoccaceae bacterium]
MSKKVLILSSSPRKGGNSDVLCDRFLQGAQDAGHQAETIFLRDKKIAYCTGCGTCSERGLPCPQKDDMAEILDKMIAADVLVLATPVYFYTMSAQLKTLIDRCCARYTEIRGKEFYFILTAADENVKEMQRTVESLRGFTYCLEDAREKGILYGLGAWRIGEIQKLPAMQQAYDMGKNI